MSDWIKLRSELDTDPRIFAMGEKLRLSAQSYILTQLGRDLFGDVTDTVTRDVLRDVTLAALTRVWFAANRHTTDGVFKNATLDYLDTLAQVPGFGQAMAAVGYAIHDPKAQTVTLPRFEEYNAPNKNGQRSKTAGAKRTAEYRRRLKEAEEKEALAKASPDSSTPPKERESDASRDVTASYSSSTSKSTVGTPSDSELRTGSRAEARQTATGSPQGGDGNRPINADVPSAPAPAPPQTSGIPESVRHLTAAKQRIDALLPKSWGKMTVWNYEEEAALHASLPNLQALDDQDWHVLAWFMRWVTTAANTSQRNPVQVTSKRHQFVTEIASVLNRAVTCWKQSGSPKLGDATKPAAKPKPAPEAAPVGPTDVFKQLATDLGIKPKEPDPAAAALAAPSVARRAEHQRDRLPQASHGARTETASSTKDGPVTLPPPDFDSPAYKALVESHTQQPASAA